jgi:hypothetical protein
MSSLYTRASPAQAQILKIVEGAIKNTSDAHPTYPRLPPNMARGIAKRAAGTLSAQWAEVLAAPPSDQAAPATGCNHERNVLLVRGEGRREGAFSGLRRSLFLLHKKLGFMAGQARRAGDIERHKALADALREIAKMMSESV